MKTRIGLPLLTYLREVFQVRGYDLVECAVSYNDFANSFGEDKNEARIGGRNNTKVVPSRYVHTGEVLLIAKSNDELEVITADERLDKWLAEDTRRGCSYSWLDGEAQVVLLTTETPKFRAPFRIISQGTGHSRQAALEQALTRASIHR